MLKQTVKVFFFMLVLTGLAYPLLITALAHLLFPFQASGSLIVKNDRLIGSYLIAQKFEADRYFWPRPSAIDYHPLPSGGSNLSLGSEKLKKLVRERRQHLLQAHPNANAVPSELLYASGSGLDPNISVATAFFQIDRVAKARQFNEKNKQRLRRLIIERSEHTPLKFFGHPCINVLMLNLALDEWTVRDE